MTENGPHLSSEYPLQGAHLCCTSIAPEIRSQLAEWAEELGAEHTLDLTSDVTHLIVGDTDSKKYQYVAKQREDVKVVLPEFIEALRELWMNNQQINMKALEAQYRCPTLHGLKICITGFEDLEFRSELAKNVHKNGGDYTGDLTKYVTHLIATNPAGKKYDYANMWQIKIVSLKWYKDTLARGMQLDEELYHPTIASEMQGAGAWIRLAPGSTRLGKRQRVEPPVQEQTRKLRRSASTRFGSQQTQMWNDIVGQQPSETSDTADAKRRPSATTFDVPQISLGIGDEIVTLVNAPPEEPPPPYRALRDDDQIQAQPKPTGIFSGKHFAVNGFDERRKEILSKHLTSHDGFVYPMSLLHQQAERDPHSCFLIVPHEIDDKRLSRVETSRANLTLVTELWLEYCISSKCFIAPHQYKFGLPVVAADLSAVSKLTVNASGFSQVQTMHIAKVVKKLGAAYNESFRKETSVLICDPTNMKQQKIDHATAWDIPVVSEKWLQKLIRTGRVPPYERYSLQATPGGDLKTHDRNTDAMATDHNKQGLSSGLVRDVDEVRSAREGKRGHTEEAQTAKARSRKEDTANPSHDQEKAPYTTGKKLSLANDNDHRLGGPKSNDPDPLCHTVVPSKHLLTKASPEKLPSTRKKLFQTYDGNSSDLAELSRVQVRDVSALQENIESLALKVDSVRIPVAIPDDAAREQSLQKTEDFVQAKPTAETKKEPEQQDTSTTKSNGLLRKAISNLSNCSRTSADNNDRSTGKALISRASSINSINTDGLGKPVSAMSVMVSDVKKRTPNGEQLSHGYRRLQGNPALTRTNTEPVVDQGVQVPQAKPVTNHLAPTGKISDIDLYAQLMVLSNSQAPAPPSPSPPAQISYAESEEATRIKAHLAEKRSQRAKLGQKAGDPAPQLSREESEEKRQRMWREEQADAVNRVIRDDVAVVGQGRRTRGREKALSALLNGQEEGQEAEPGNLF